MLQEHAQMKSIRRDELSSSSSDIVSTLPENILETILCFLPTEDAARTSILSKEWRYKWTKIPNLEFHMSHASKEITKEKQWIRRNMGPTFKRFYDLHQVLLSHQGPIHEFRLVTDQAITNQGSFGLDQILLHLSKNHKVKKLTLLGDEVYSKREKLPISVFSFHHLTDLQLCCFDLDYQPILDGFGTLRSLSLYNLRISTTNLLHLLSNCPSLKSLTLWLIVLVHVPRELPTLPFHLKYFCMKAICFANGQGLEFFLVLLKCSPNLEKIEIWMEWGPGCFEDPEDHSALWKEYSNVWLEHLNELKVYNFHNLKPEMKFVKFVLARSPKLKKVEIRSVVDCKQELEMLKTLLDAPRVSLATITIR